MASLVDLFKPKKKPDNRMMIAGLLRVLSDLMGSSDGPAKRRKPRSKPKKEEDTEEKTEAKVPLTQPFRDPVIRTRPDFFPRP